MRIRSSVLSVGSDWRGQVTIGDTRDRAQSLLRSAVNVGFGSHRLVGCRGEWVLGQRSSPVDGSLVGQEVRQLVRHLQIVRRCVLPGQGDRGLVDVLRKRHEGSVLVVVPFTIVDLLPAKNSPCQGQRSPRHGRWLGRDKVTVVERDLADVGSHVLNLLVVPLLRDNELGEEVDGRVTNGPIESVENMHLHLGEHASIIKSTAHVVELVDLGNTVLLVAILGSDQQSSAANKLVVLLVHDPFRAVTVQEVDSEEQCLGQQLEGSVGLDEEVDEVGTHKPLDLSLHVDEASIWEGLVLCLFLCK